MRESTQVILLHPYGAEPPQPCKAGYRFVPGDETVVLRVPRTCMGDPRWVRLHVYCLAWLPDPAATATIDDALRKGYRERFPYSPRLVPAA